MTLTWHVSCIMKQVWNNVMQVWLWCLGHWWRAAAAATTCSHWPPTMASKRSTRAALARRPASWTDYSAAHWWLLSQYLLPGHLFFNIIIMYIFYNCQYGYGNRFLMTFVCNNTWRHTIRHGCEMCSYHMVINKLTNQGYRVVLLLYTLGNPCMFSLKIIFIIVRLASSA